jgi:hypothetical protein
VNPKPVIAAVGVLGAVGVVVGILNPLWIPFVPGAPWLVLTAGLVYLAAAVAAWTLLETEYDTCAVAVAPAVLAPVVALFSFYGADVISELVEGPGLFITAFAAVVFGLGLSFPLAAATRSRQQWAVVGALALAAVPLIVAAVSALSPGPPEDRDLVVLIGMIVLTVAPLFAVPTYALGTFTRRRDQAADPSPYPPLVAAATPFALVLAGFVPAPYFARETIYGSWIVIVPALALLAILLQGVRVGERAR